MGTVFFVVADDLLDQAKGTLPEDCRVVKAEPGSQFWPSYVLYVQSDCFPEGERPMQVAPLIHRINGELWWEWGLPGVPLQKGVRHCRICGCTEKRACEGGCYWVEYDLCSSCIAEATMEEGRESDPEVCPICGHARVWEECWDCGGEGYRDLYDEDPLWYDEDDVEACDVCHGNGGYWVCSNNENHERILAQAKGWLYYQYWKVKIWWMVWKSGWWYGKFTEPVRRCYGCGRISGFLWFYVGNHDGCLPF